MQFKGINAGGRRARVLVLASLGMVACATGVDPVRPGGEGGNGGTSVSGPGSGATSSSTSGAAVSSSSTSGAHSSSSASGAGGASSSSSSSAVSSSASGPPVMGLSVQYLCGDTNASDNQMKPHFSIFNNSNVSVPLSSLKIRYYFTIDGGPISLQFNCDYAAPGAGACGNITSSFGSVMGVNTDHYLEVGFSNGNLAPGMATGEIQARVNKSDFSQCNQSNDYSFDPTKVAFTDWDKVTLYQNGTLVWGVEP